MTMNSAIDFIESIQTDGRLTFTMEQAIMAIGASPSAVRAQLRRLRQKGRIAAPYRGFHVVVPPQYRRLGCLPAEHFIPDLMAYLKEPYYVSLLSAAAFFGASHQSPMIFQVMVSSSRRGISCGGVRVDFIARQDMKHTSTIQRNVPTGSIRISSPEATALELVGYPARCGYLDNVATVLAELTEQMKNKKALIKEATRAPSAWVQRLGYLLELVGAGTLADSLDGVLSDRTVFPVALAPWLNMRDAKLDSRWNVAINTTVVPDI